MNRSMTILGNSLRSVMWCVELTSDYQYASTLYPSVYGVC